MNLFCVQQTYFLPVIGLVDAEQLKPGDLVVSDGDGVVFFYLFKFMSYLGDTLETDSSKLFRLLV